MRRVLAHWRERRSWWRDALDPVPGQPTGIDVASAQEILTRHADERNEASPGEQAARLVTLGSVV